MILAEVEKSRIDKNCRRPSAFQELYHLESTHPVKAPDLRQ